MKTITNYFIVILALSDLTLVVLCGFLSAVPYFILQHWPYGNLLCRIINYIQSVSVYLTAYTLIAISLDRYYALLHPLKKKMTQKIFVMVVTLIISVSLLFPLPLLIFSKLSPKYINHTFTYNNETVTRVIVFYQCGEKWPNGGGKTIYTFFLLFSAFILPIGILTYTYLKIVYHLWWSKVPGEAMSVRDSKITRSRKKLIKMLILVIIMFTVCWFPHFLIMLLYELVPNYMGTLTYMLYVYVFGHSLCISNSCYNPFIYAYLNKRFRKGFLHYLHLLFYYCFCCCGIGCRPFRRCFQFFYHYEPNENEKNNRLSVENNHQRSLKLHRNYSSVKKFSRKKNFNERIIETIIYCTKKPTAVKRDDYYTLSRKNRNQTFIRNDTLNNNHYYASQRRCTDNSNDSLQSHRQIISVSERTTIGVNTEETGELSFSNSLRSMSKLKRFSLPSINDQIGSSLLNFNETYLDTRRTSDCNKLTKTSVTMSIEKRVKKTKTKRGKRFLDNRSPKIIEDTKSSIFVRCQNANLLSVELLKDLKKLKEPHTHSFTRKNPIVPFEDDHPIEHFCDKTDSSLFAMVSNSKKRPNNLIMGRLYEKKVTDMFEMRMMNMKHMKDFKTTAVAIGCKPCLIFNGIEWTSDEKLLRLRNFFIDYFRGDVIKELSEDTLSLVISFTMNQTNLYFRTYQISMNQENDINEKYELNEIGPRMDLTLNRYKLSDDKTHKLSCKLPTELKKTKKIKTAEKDEFGSLTGRVHMKKQNLNNLKIIHHKSVKRLKGKE
ncbi:hypothetical protein SNEBB_001732 [Seison nebaliae]|nr:hypothetical protein SNEBB_001732 [Seison nebaliae]